MSGMASEMSAMRKKHVDSAEGKFTFIDLFAGIGGIRHAFDKAGGTCLFSSEWDKYPAKMYEDNYGEKPAGDITKIKAEDIPAHDVLVGGFPCQPFSIAGVSKKESMGKKHGFEDETQGTLFFDVARIIKYHKPKMFLLENVKNLKSHDKGNTFRVIIKTLKELGYDVQEKIIDGGLLVPQHRERIYIVGTLDHSEPFVFPEIKSKNLVLDDILEKEGTVDERYTLSDKLWAGLQRHANKHKAKGNGFGFGLKKRDERARTLSARYYKDGSEILIDQGPNKNPRRLTPFECGRLMGFPKKFKITLSDTRAYKCFGNSVVVPVVERLAKQIAKHQIITRGFVKDLQ
ncbi:MAG: DNA (cytosine-5-)-methyltransferase [Halobacteriovorax sp. JY17]|nr:MAG: DNA (cytosine-5-)-methyltransferase [Halobacteriovorax sp. JY17]